MIFFLKKTKFFTNFRCPYCGKCFKQRMTYSAHISKHKAKEAKKFTCKQCDKSFNSNYYLNKHLAVHDKTVKKSLACTHCGKRLDIHRIRLMLRISTYMISKIIFCLLRYTSEKSLRAHIMFHHNEDGEAKGVICEFCGRQFISRASVISHVHTVHRTESDPNNQKV